MSATGLFDALGVIPSLPGAQCAGQHRLFDEARPGEDEDVVDQRHAEALGLCARCPALDRCLTWLLDLPPSRRPTGVIAGQLNVSKSRGPGSRNEIRPRFRRKSTNQPETEHEMTASPITVGYSDEGIVLQTASGATVVMPPNDALALAAAIARAAKDHAAHLGLMAAVDDAVDDGSDE